MLIKEQKKSMEEKMFGFGKKHCPLLLSVVEEEGRKI